MFECIFLGDTGSGNIEQNKVADSIEKFIKKKPNIKSVIVVGDNIYPDGCTDIHDTQFNTKFRDIYKNIDLPFYLCLGNHDYHTNPQSQIDYTFSQYNNENKYFKKWNLPSKWYTQNFTSCDIFFIDTNFKHLSEDIIQKQLRDTIQSINNSKKRWKILCGHHTWRSVGGHGNAEPRHETFMDDLLKQVHIDIYICGHDHCKSLIHVGKYNIPTLVIGTGGKVYDDNLIFLENTKYDNSQLDFFSPNLGMCYMKSNDKSLSLTCYNEKLQKEYSIKL
tara:strand:- start:2027 stop:2857 length:831 start_codon:yes stop_codon:yes gene_type:complete